MTRRKSATPRTERQHQLRVWIPRSLSNRLRDDADASGETISTIVRQLIAARLASSHRRRAVSRTSHLHKT
jgi:hypothetical protein